MRRWLVKLASLAVIALGAATLTTSSPASVQAVDCCYSDCMEFCTEDRTFRECHFTCNQDCQAC